MMYKVEICGVDTGTLPVLKHEETRQLLLRGEGRGLCCTGTAYRWKSSSGAVGNTKIFSPWRESGRPVSSGLHWSDEGNRQFQH